MNREKRYHLLLDEWVVLAGTTNNRPWSGEKLKVEESSNLEFDPNCYLCPQVKRASGEQNPNYTSAYAFNNDFASFALNAPNSQKDERFEKTKPVCGVCRVLCYSPKHNITLAQMSELEINCVVNLWKTEFETLAKNEVIENILIFENKGKQIGVSNPHPHGQIYATDFVPKIVERELLSMQKYKSHYDSCLLCDLAAEESRKRVRIVSENAHFVAFVPFFARFVFETYIIPRRHFGRITQITEEEQVSLVQILKQVLVKFDNLYNMPFPNIMMLHNSPINRMASDDFHFHIEFYPPMRSPDKLKYLAGFESGGGNIINPVAPEEAALQMRESSEVHYLTNK